MRIQHNITAMNSYRNLSANQSKLNKNLEKLSTGYKVNRAADDAAGLAISEKMRAQISGLEQATRNAKDGSSLIQTAEGALTEVHDMLNRMVTLAEQSANGTYDDTVDRVQLQKEVDALKEEIDRVAESTNYNGIKLLDGSLSGAGTIDGNIKTSDSIATAASATVSAFAANSAYKNGGLEENDKISFTMNWIGNDGKSYTKTVDLKVSQDRKSLIGGKDDKVTMYANGGTAGTFTATHIAKAVIGELQKDDSLTEAFDIKLINAAGADDADGVALKFESKVKGANGAEVTGVDTKFTDAKTGDITSGTTVGASSVTRTKGKDSLQKLDFTNIKVLTSTNVTASGDAEKAINDNTFSIDGKKFVFISKNDTYDYFKNKVGADTTIIKLDNHASNADLTNSGANFSNNTADNQKIAAELSRYTGRDVTVQATAPGTGTVEAKAGIVQNDILVSVSGKKLSKEGKALMLQVGDTSDSYNRVGVTVGDMHVNALGLRDVDVSNQDGAAKAVSVIKHAVNTVSDTRGGLGALQNRLDHTINNLGVMRENIQSAEGLIRDTDVAEEMMIYTKNNILNQSAQAMLAQANQLPQGVLQLLG